MTQANRLQGGDALLQGSDSLAIVGNGSRVCAWRPVSFQELPEVIAIPPSLIAVRNHAAPHSMKVAPQTDGQR